MKIVSQLGNSVSSRFEEEQCVCPPKLKENLFTVGAVDNIDHNTSSLRSKDSFHGTAVSLMQFPTPENRGVPRGMPLIIPKASSNDVTPMPAEYTDVTEVSLVRECYAPETLGDVKTQSDALLTSRTRENEWLSDVEVLRAKESRERKRLHIMGCISCQQATSGTTCLQYGSAATFHRESTVSFYDPSCHESHQASSAAPQPSANTCDYSRHASVCYLQTDSVAVASDTWRRKVCCHA